MNCLTVFYIGGLLCHPKVDARRPERRCSIFSLNVSDRRLRWRLLRPPRARLMREARHYEHRLKSVRIVRNGYTRDFLRHEVQITPTSRAYTIISRKGHQAVVTSNLGIARACRTVRKSVFR